MLKRALTLWLAMMFSFGMLAQAADERPTSMDRHLAPDQYPTNVVKILRTTNKAQTNSYVPVVFTMRNNNPFNVIRMLLRPVQEEEGLMFTFVSPEGNGGKVLYVVPKYMIPSLDALVKSLDIPGLTTSANDIRTYRQLKHRRAVTYEFDSTSVPRFANADEGFIRTAASFSTGNGAAFIADPENNALYWSDSPAGAAALDGALTTWLDVPTAMVQLLVKIYELDSYNDGTIGLDYQSWKNTLGQDLFSGQAFSEYGSIHRANSTLFPPLNTGAISLPSRGFASSGYNYAYNYEVSSEFFDYLQAKGKARLLNQSKLAALNTHRAKLTAGDQVLYYRVSAGSSSREVTGTVGSSSLQAASVSSTSDSNGDSSSAYCADTGLTLRFTPTIGEQTVSLAIKLDWTDYNGFDASGTPLLNPRSLKTNMRLGVGEETVIGGLKRQVRVQQTSKVPFLGSLPIIGYAFGGETNTNKNSEMIVAIKALGIMDYKLAGGSMVKEDDQMVIDKALGDAPANLPDTKWGFDMYAMDHDMTATVGSVK